jgi:hypothetical protein
MNHQGSNARLSAVIEFTRAGSIKSILINADNEEGQAIVEKALKRLAPQTLRMDGRLDEKRRF